MTTNAVLPTPTAVVPARRRRFGWPMDLALGFRLAVGGGRTSLARLVLGTIGIGMATALLLMAASVGHILAGENAREAGAQPDSTRVAGVAPLDLYIGDTEYQGTFLAGSYVRATGPNSPVPPGVARLPGPDEVVLSPALARLLDSPAGALLRPRFPQRVIGLIADEGLTGPAQLTYYAGLSTSQFPADQPPQHVYSYGVRGGSSPINPTIQVLVVVGAVVLLMPILIMVTVSSRIAGAQRDRRLAALRLVGAGARQVRRIAAAESLAAAGTGLVLGVAVFLALRALASHVDVLGLSAFTSDVTPPWPLVVLIVLLVPVLAVGSALAALRRTVIEPLGVVRGGRPVRRRVWWRAGLVVVGVGALFYAHRLSNQGLEWTEMVALGASALLVGVPVLLPWLLERAVAALRGGPVSWQLAVRRLQLDSGTPARVVGGVAVVLAGAIAVQTLLAAASSHFEVSSSSGGTSPTDRYVMQADSSVATRTTAALRRSPVVSGVYSTSVLVVSSNVADAADNGTQIQLASCATIREITGITDCVDGDVFDENDGMSIRPGTHVTAVQISPTGNGVRAYGRWTVPTHLRSISGRAWADMNDIEAGALLVTPGALAGVRLPPVMDTLSVVTVRPNMPNALEYVRDALAAYPLQAYVMNYDDPTTLGQDQRAFLAVRNGLLVGSLFTLLLAGISLLVLALEQVRERRRPLAILSAAGVSRSVLARSLLWQTAVPVLVGVLAAIATGIGLAALVLRMSSVHMVLDWAGIGMFCGSAVGLVLLVTIATLPALHNATRLSALRTE